LMIDRGTKRAHQAHPCEATFGSDDTSRTWDNESPAARHQFEQRTCRNINDNIPKNVIKCGTNNSIVGADHDGFMVTDRN
jgi:hypothetical protein